MASNRRRHHLGFAPWLAGAAVGLLALAPLARPGFILSYDMVFVPRLRLSADLVGLGAAVPRAVPNEVLVALVSRILPASLVEKVILAGIFVVGAAGAGRLTPTSSGVARATAGVFFVWNAFTYERLLLGHWTLLVSFAALPWVVAAALRVRRSTRSWRPLAGWLAVACFGSAYGGVIAMATAILVAAWPTAGAPRRTARSAAAILGLGLALSAPWLIPSLLHPGGLPVRPTGVAAFEAKADSPMGTAGSVLTLGGIWNDQVVPPGRDSVWWIPAFALILLLSLAGWRSIFQRWPRGGAFGLLAAAGAGFVLAAAPTLPGLGGGFASVVDHLPGGGLLRDSQKFAAPLALAEAVGLGVGAELVLSALNHPRVRRAAAALMMAGPVAILPAMAWGAGGELQAVRYPRDWEAARSIMAADPVPGGMLVLPWHLYLALPWNGHHTVLSPAQRYFTRRAVVNDDLELVSQTIPGEDPWAMSIDPLIRSGRPLDERLRSFGIRYVLVLKIGAWDALLPRLTELPRVAEGSSLILYKAPPPVTPSFRSPPVIPVVAADALTFSLVLWMGGPSLVRARRQLLSFVRNRTEGR